MKRDNPLVGITGNFGDKGCELAEGYYRSVLKAGGTPVVIPPHYDKEALVTLLDTLDGIIFSGGGDLNPLLLGEEPLLRLWEVRSIRTSIRKASLLGGRLEGGYSSTRRTCPDTLPRTPSTLRREVCFKASSATRRHWRSTLSTIRQ